MELPKGFEAVCRAMADPAFYPHPVARVERRDTHISAVFLTGACVYKLKKPVDFGFLDFRDLDARRHFCEQEVWLNQRLSRGVYRGVAVIRRNAAGNLALEGEGEPVEYAVKMRQLPEEASMRVLLATGRLDRSDMQRLGRHLAAFYRSSPRSPEIDRYGRVDVIRKNMEENFEQVDPFVDEMDQRERWEFIREVSRAFFLHHRGQFDRRVSTGRVCDGHGDLRAEHIYFDDDIQIIDCVEFNDRFRYGDAIIDLAFLHMDMEHLGQAELSREVLAAYVEEARDPELYALIDFYAAYRAIVKMKVACLRSIEVKQREERLELLAGGRGYLDQAYRYAMQFGRPTLWVFCGLPATGKSSLAERVAGALKLELFQSDAVRKQATTEALSEPTVEEYDRGAYRQALRQRVYTQMLALAYEELKQGRSVLLDATFSRRKWREEAVRLAKDLDTTLIFVECVSREATIRHRLKERESRGGLSDARLQHLEAMMSRFEPLAEVPAQSYSRVDTEQEMDKALVQLLSNAYALRCAQVEKLCRP